MDTRVVRERKVIPIVSADKKAERRKNSALALKDNELDIDEQRLVVVCRIVLALLRERKGPFAFIPFWRDCAPQELFRPPECEVGSLEHFRWLYHAGATDTREKSENVYDAHRRMYSNCHVVEPLIRVVQKPTRWLYEREALMREPREFADAIANAKIGSPGRAKVRWPILSQTLWQEWGGDPMGLFPNGTVASAMTLKEKNDLIPGIGPKVASLIATFFMFSRPDLPVIRDAFAVDVHIQRIMLALRVVVPKRFGTMTNDTLESAIRPLITRLCIEHAWDQVELSHALWFFARMFCAQCPTERAVPSHCPFYKDCCGSLASESYFRQGLWIWTETVGPRPKFGQYDIRPPGYGLFVGH